MKKNRQNSFFELLQNLENYERFIKKKIFLFVFLICFFSFIFVTIASARQIEPRINPGRNWKCSSTDGGLVWECIGTCAHCGIFNEKTGKYTPTEACIFGQDGQPPCRVGWLNNNPDCACCGDCTLNDMLWMGANVANIILRYLGVAALALFVAGGIIWMTSGGAPEKVNQGKNIIKGAVIGLVIVLGAYFTVNYILDILAPEYRLSEEKKVAISWPDCPVPPTNSRPWCYGCTWTGQGRGCHDPEVKIYQLMLNHDGYNCGKEDGRFGPDTRDCTRRFQKAQGLTVDGMVGPDTYQKYEELYFQSTTH